MSLADGKYEPPDMTSDEVVQVEDHVSEIMFDSLSSPEVGCALCSAGITLGVWKRFGVDDPFAPEDE